MMRAILSAALLVASVAVEVVISNEPTPRKDTSGTIMDAHDVRYRFGCPIYDTL